MENCPKCGSHNVVKENYLGSKTGDLECLDCGDTWWPRRGAQSEGSPQEEKKTEK